MKQQVLKALANPAHIFYVPYNLAVLNFISLFIIFAIIFITAMVVTRGKMAINPLYFLVVVIITHSIIAIFSKRDPQLGQIVTAKIQLMKRKIPRKLAA
ncbi:MAG: VirB3 family type IV secretion system protein [Alphaproteobacteria bacterium]|nr:VirB3 family type IV secretion system protein [Alphaproteobacteria bacterium]